MSFNLGFSLLIYKDSKIRKLNLQLIWSEILNLKISTLRWCWACRAPTPGVILSRNVILRCNLCNFKVVLGMPGPYTWRGTLQTSNTSKHFLMRDKTKYQGPVTENDSPVDKYSYLGKH